MSSLFFCNSFFSFFLSGRLSFGFHFSPFLSSGKLKYQLSASGFLTICSVSGFDPGLPFSRVPLGDFPPSLLYFRRARITSYRDKCSIAAATNVQFSCALPGIRSLSREPLFISPFSVGFVRVFFFFFFPTFALFKCQAGHFLNWHLAGASSLRLPLSILLPLPFHHFSRSGAERLIPLNSGTS